MSATPEAPARERRTRGVERSAADVAPEPRAGPPAGTLTFWIGWSLCRLSFVAPFPRRVVGLEHVPPTGPVLIVANHVSFLDIPAVGTCIERHVSFVARESLTDSSFMRWFLPQCDAILVRRGEADRAALREIVARLEAGGAVAIFPEGTRSADGRVHAFKGGALYAALRTGAPVVPCGVRGTEHGLSRSGRVRPARVEVHFGPPIQLDPETDRAAAEEDLRRRVAALADRDLA